MLDVHKQKFFHSFLKEQLLTLCTSTCSEHIFFLPLISSRGMSHCALNEMTHHHTTKASEAISRKPYQVNG